MDRTDVLAELQAAQEIRRRQQRPRMLRGFQLRPKELAERCYGILLPPHQSVHLRHLRYKAGCRCSAWTMIGNRMRSGSDLGSASIAMWHSGGS